MHQSVASQSDRFLPVIIGAVGLAAITALRAAVVIVIALITGRWLGVGMALLAVAVAAAGGAAGGLVYVYLGAPLRRVPIVGPYLAGIVTIGSYLAIILLLIERIEPGKGLSFNDPSGRFSYILCTLLLGVIAGHAWFRDV